MLSAGHICFRHFLPPSYVRYAMFVPRDDHLGAARQGLTVFAARPARLPCTGLRKDDLARAGSANRAADAAQHSHSFVVRRIEVAIMFKQQLRHEPKDDHRSRKSGDHRQNQYAGYHKRGVARQQVARTSEPCQKCRDGSEVQKRHLRACSACGVYSSRGRRATVRQMKVDVRQVKASTQERHDAQGHSYEKAHEIEHGPSHTLAPANLLCRPPRCGDSPRFGFKTSVSRSTNSGASKMAPSSIRHLRESLCLATCSSVWLSSGSRANCSAPLISHKSSRSSIARKSLVNSV